MEQYSVLIVEDDKEIRDGIEIFLKSQNYKVFKAGDGVEGVEIIEREKNTSQPFAADDSFDRIYLCDLVLIRSIYPSGFYLRI